MSVQEVSYDHAIELANAERYDEALVILDQLSQAQPQVVDFDCLRARLHFDRGDAQAAFAVLDAALAKLPGLPLPLLLPSGHGFARPLWYIPCQGGAQPPLTCANTIAFTFSMHPPFVNR